MNHYLELALIVVGVIIVVGGLYFLGRYLVNRFGTPWISKAQAIVANIQSALAGLGVLPANVTKLLSDIVQSIVFTLATAVSGATVQQLVTVALGFIEDISTIAGVPLDDAAVALITNVLNIVFDFIVSIKYSEKVTESNYVNAYPKLARVAGIPEAAQFTAKTSLEKHINITLTQRKLDALKAA